MNSRCILVTGGAGFIGSHTVVQLLEQNYNVVVFDNLCNSAKIAEGASKPESLLRAEKLTGKCVHFVLGDLLDKDGLRAVFLNNPGFDSVIHFAAYKSVGQSCLSPMSYYKNNITGSLNLLEVMSEFNVKRLIFSSSSTVYGHPKYLPLDEAHPTGNCVSPYGRTKYMMEQLMHDVCKADPEWKAIMLRYFNPIGAHPSGHIGEDPPGVPRNLVPYICQIGVGRLDCLSVFGTDYATPDGTAIRGYVHVMDVANGHIAAMNKLNEPSTGPGWKVYNLGMGKGHSVFDIIAAFEVVMGQKVPYVAVDRRRGDVPMTYANCKLAEEELGWVPERSLEDMCADSWRWQVKNPMGYKMGKLG